MTKKRARGVFERPEGSGVWWILYYDAEGERHREKIGRQQQAIEAYVNRKREIREGRYVPPTRAALATFKDIADKAIENKKTFMSAGTVHNDEIRIGRLKALGAMPAAKISATVIEQTLRELQAEDKTTGSTINRYRSFISSVFSYALRRGMVPRNPCNQVDRYKESEHRIRFLDEAEETALLAAVEASDFPERRHSVLLAMNTGIRLGEQNALTWGNVAIQRGMLTVPARKTQRRFIPLNAEARAALLALREISEGELVSPGWSHKWFTTCVKKSGIVNFHWHDLRHTFASRLVMAGVDLRTVMELMGHASMEMTLRYAHLAPAHTQSAVNKLDTYTEATAAIAAPGRQVPLHATSDQNPTATATATPAATAGKPERIN